MRYQHKEKTVDLWSKNIKYKLDPRDKKNFYVILYKENQSLRNENIPIKFTDNRIHRFYISQYSCIQNTNRVWTLVYKEFDKS